MPVRALNSLTSWWSAPHPTDGSTDANAALARGIPALSLGCAHGHDMHALTERIELASLEQGRAQLDGVLRRLLAPGTSSL